MTRRDWSFVMGVAVLALAGIVAALLLSPTESASVPAPQVTTVTVYVPAGPAQCPTESDCRADWDGNRWVIVPDGDR